ncbi:ABC transporter, permease [Thioalkalivibrio versutus]|uniref:ABC transporter, permease n=1 Tax=Thioalkalivibrio versutus TaxID=106634 RepID=A0A0G3G2F3_9GAMM|nr:ABC transporter permease [Thioalkalivibrio versutus]AKJ95385.1 ABC transporter, permease [Thioalkalivibrio versutus]
MSGLVLRAWLRDWRRRPLQRVLTLVGVIIGVAVVLAVDLANQSAQRAFDRSMDEVAGAATHQVLGPASGFDEAFYRDLRMAGWRDTAPIVEGPARLPDGTTIYVLGVDPLAEGPFRGAASDIGDAPVQRLVTEPGTILPPAGWFRASGEAHEARRVLEAAGGEHEVTLIDRAAERDEPDEAPSDDAGASLWVTDIATAQVLLDRLGRLDRIDLRLADDEVEALVAALPAELELVAVESRGQAARQLAQAFRINLTAMSLLALLIAAFLIYNTQTFAVLRRREVIASLRLVGVGRRAIFGVVLLEALLVGVIGTLLGALLGVALAQVLVAQVAQTVTDHFFAVAVTGVTPRPLALAAVLLLGVGLSLAAALAPAWEAARVASPAGTGRGGLERRARGWAVWLALASIVLLLAGVGLIVTGAGALVGGFVALFLLIAGFVLLLPWVLAWTLRGLAVLVRGAALPRIAVRSLERSLSRSAPATSALTLALAAAIGVAVMVGSFRGSVEQWLGQALTSDLYVVPAAPASARGGARLPEDWTADLVARSGAVSVSSGTSQEVVSDRGLVDLYVVRPHADWLDYLPLLEAAVPREALGARLAADDAVLVTEPFAAHHDVGLGDRLSLAAAGGRRAFDILGIYRDYGNPQGTVLMTQAAFARGGAPPDGVGSFGLRLPDGADAEQAVEHLEAWLAAQDHAALVTRPGDIEQESMAIFDRTFAITHLLRVITLVVAFIAILGALIALQMERAREFATLRSLGLLPGGVRGLVVLQGGVLGVFAALAAIPLGLGMGWLLIEVINREAFGWGMDLRLPWVEVGETVLLGVGAALLASVIPAWRMARMRLVPALREVP